MTTWSAQQQAIFEWFRLGQGNLVVRARAGSGKTTTVIEGITCAPEDRILLSAFNKRNATELDRRLTHRGAEARTLHSIGYRFVRDYIGNCAVDSKGKRAKAIAAQVCKGAPVALLKTVVKMAAVLKAVSPTIGSGDEILPEEVAFATGTAEAFDISIDEEWEESGYEELWLSTCAIEMLRFGSTYDDGTVDFDDMVWLPVRNRWARPRYDLVVIDECQDMNRTQINLAMMSCHKAGRIAVVGDDKQAIYGFRGADSTSIDRLLKALNAKEMGLTTTYRCGKAIVREARRLVPDFHAYDGNPEGKVERTNIGICLEKAEPGDFILSRTNAPLVSACLKLLRDGKRANIEGKDVGAGLKSIIRKLNKGASRKNFKAFCLRLDNWHTKEIEKARERGEKGLPTLARVSDQYETLCSLMDGLESADEMINRIESLFDDTDENKGLKIILSSVHRAKGLEADRVWALEDTFFSRSSSPPDWADGKEERNIEYVAVTRAKSLFTWVEGTL